MKEPTQNMKEDPIMEWKKPLQEWNYGRPYTTGNSSLENGLQLYLEIFCSSLNLYNGMTKGNHHIGTVRLSGHQSP
jgi:hypothetical protein